MDKAQAIHAFWSGFGLPAYDQNTVPDTAEMPYITYSVATGALDDIIAINGSLWYHSLSWAEISRKADEISMAVSNNGLCTIPVDDGYVWIKRGSPFAQRMEDADGTIRRIYINLGVEFLTAC